MKEMTTKHGHKWLLPETVGEFQQAGANIDALCGYATNYIKYKMAIRSAQCAKGLFEWNQDCIKSSLRRKHSPVKKAAKLAAKLTPEVRAALLAELQKEVDNGQD